jgi:hypothetical protein
MINMYNFYMNGKNNNSMMKSIKEFISLPKITLDL